MRRKLIALQHVDREGPGRVAVAAHELGLELTVVPLHQGRSVPTALAPDEALIVMGGPMGVSDLGDARHPFLADEVALLRRCLTRAEPVLGVCLGAQLLAHAAGARVFPNTRSSPGGGPARAIIELGWAPVRFHRIDQEPLLAGMREQESMLHWHGDTFDLPADAVRLASTDVCPNQAFRLGDHAVALQFHAEADADLVARWVNEDAAYVERALGPHGRAQVLKQTAARAREHQDVGDRLLRNVLQSLCLRPG